MVHMLQLQSTGSLAPGVIGKILSGRGVKRGDDISSGGRLSRRNADPIAEAERKAQQEKLYSLDLDRVLAGPFAHLFQAPCHVDEVDIKYGQVLQVPVALELYIIMQSSGRLDLLIILSNKTSVAWQAHDGVLGEACLDCASLLTRKWACRSFLS